jgi:long-chain acyl-CoA synthetase
MGYAAGDAVPASAVQRRADGFVSFGERGVSQSDGSFVLLGRGAEAVTVSDRTVFPAAIESWLMAQAGVVHAAVLVRPDPLRGHRLEAAICAQGSDLAGLRAGLRRAFGPSGCPTRIVALDDWPMLPSGKTDREALQAGLAQP